MPEYIAIYQVDSSFSDCFDLKKPGSDLKVQKILAETPEDAFRLAVQIARSYADNLKGFSLGQVAIRINAFHDSKANAYAQKELSMGQDLEFDDGRVVVKSSLEDIAGQ